MNALLLLKIDVVPTEQLVFVWLSLVACGALGFFMCHRRRAFLFVILPLAFILGYMSLAGVAYSYFGSGTLTNVNYGSAYLLSYLSIGVAFVAPFIGAFSKRSRYE
jgi:uncharacterized ion transporter superfamily protein YfcC